MDRIREKGEDNEAKIYNNETNLQEIIEGIENITDKNISINRNSLKSLLGNEKILTKLLKDKEENNEEIDCNVVQEITRTLIDLVVAQKGENEKNLQKLKEEKLKIIELNNKLLEENKSLKKDNLTGLLNRHGFDIAFNQSLEVYKENGCNKENIFSFGIIDIDDFKAINDTYGHTIGDAVLRYLSKFIKSNLRKGFEIYRFGGEEFVILGKCDSIVMVDELNLILKKLKKFFITPKKDKNKKIKISYSGGVSSIDEINQADIFIKDSFEIYEEMYDISDRLLYKAKDIGKGIVL